MSEIVLRFVHCEGAITELILFDENGCKYSHVELLTRRGTYIGAHVTGVEERPMDYDAGKFSRELFMLLPASDEMEAKCEHYMRAVAEKHEGYGLLAIFGFVTHMDLNKSGTVICSALVTLALRWCECLPRDLTIAAHRISVRDLFLGLMMRPDMRIITPADPVFTAHVAGGRNG